MAKRARITKQARMYASTKFEADLRAKEVVLPDLEPAPWQDRSEARRQALFISVAMLSFDDQELTQKMRADADGGRDQTAIDIVEFLTRQIEAAEADVKFIKAASIRMMVALTRVAEGLDRDGKPVGATHG